jgi:alanyl-tRNA synthetase
LLNFTYILKKSAEIRQDFLDFFASKGHKVVPSASVVPQGDPTLLFVNAGMNQFKDIFLGTAKAGEKRIVDTQKCIRVSGKHNDLEEVGHDGYHHTFFEMLGNWSFGDYYKKEAISWAWELLTKVWKLDKNRLWVTVFETDYEAMSLWKTETDIDHSHILKFGAKDNFWEMGDTGPCGPCSEIHYDFTPNGCKPEDVNAGNPDVMEIWNLVFIQYNRDSTGQLDELPDKHIDTGMGFERMVRVHQNKTSNYLTDVFLPVINEIISITGKEYSGRYEAPMNVIADHVRTLTFAIGDGAIPSNEGRGYVLRRVLRRAARYGRNLDMHKPFIYKLVDTLVNTMGHVFPEIVEHKERIKDILKGEEESFNKTLDKGIDLFNDEIEKMKKFGSKTFSGEVAFKLHDTYGFPVDLTELMAREIGYDVDVPKFEELMKNQKEKARIDRSGKIDKSIEDVIQNPPGDKFDAIIKDCVYDPYNIEGDKIETEIKFVRELITPIEGNLAKIEILCLKHNPLYTESGGQVSDIGKIILPDNDNVVLNVYKSEKNYVIVYPHNNTIKPNTKAFVEVDFPRRQSIQRNHSATHIVHESLRRVLGSHIKQMGSYLDDKLLRFDFPHFHKLSAEEIKKIENMVNSKIGENIDVVTEELPIDEAKARYPNLRMFFGDKYGDIVRVVVIDKDFSVELCGGTHVKNTSDIGLFKIIKEESISSGTRRIIAITGEGIIEYVNERSDEIEKLASELPENIAANFKLGMDNLRKEFKGVDFRDTDSLKKIMESHESTINSLHEIRAKYLEEKKQQDKEAAKQKVQDASGSIDELIAKAQDVSGFKLISSKFDVDTMDELKEIGDKVREKMGSGVALLYSVIDDKIALVAVVSDHLVKEKKLSAGKIAGDVAKILGGGGGGKPHLATAGGKDISKIDEAVSSLPEIIKKYL